MSKRIFVEEKKLEKSRKMFDSMICNYKTNCYIVEITSRIDHTSFSGKIIYAIKEQNNYFQEKKVGDLITFYMSPSRPSKKNKGVKGQKNFKQFDDKHVVVEIDQYGATGNTKLMDYDNSFLKKYCESNNIKINNNTESDEFLDDDIEIKIEKDDNNILPDENYDDDDNDYSINNSFYINKSINEDNLISNKKELRKQRREDKVLKRDD